MQIGKSTLLIHALLSNATNEKLAIPSSLEKQSELMSPTLSDLTKDMVEVVIRDFDAGKRSGQMPLQSEKGNLAPSSPLQDLNRPGSDGPAPQISVDNKKAASPDKKTTYKDIINKNMNASIPKMRPQHPYEKCYVINTDLIPMSEVGKIVDQFETHSNSVRFIYKRNLLGFTFCTASNEILDKIRGKYSLINIEEDKIFRIGSIENDMRYLYNLKPTGTLDVSDFEEDFFNFPNRSGYSKSNEYMGGTVRYGVNGMVQLPVPMHFYRIMNMGNAFFNNYLLDNCIFRFLRINRLIKYFYRYEHFYTGRNVNITVIDTPKCNEHKQVNSSLISGFGNSLAKNATLHTIEAFGCDGTIKLSKLLNILENIHRTDILVLPFSGPHSEALNLSLKRISQSTLIIAAGGNDSENSCNHSPSGHHLIKVGSVDKNGYISTFSNRGTCINLYSLGEDVLHSNGTSYSASFVAGAAAIFLEKHPGASHDKVLRYLMDNTTKNEYKFSILKIPRIDPRSEIKRDLPYYTWKDVVIYNAVLIIATMVVLYGLFRLYRRYRTNTADSQYILSNLRERRRH